MQYLIIALLSMWYLIIVLLLIGEGNFEIAMELKEKLEVLKPSWDVFRNKIRYFLNTSW